MAASIQLPGAVWFDTDAFSDSNVLVSTPATASSKVAISFWLVKQLKDHNLIVRISKGESYESRWKAGS